VVGAFTFLAGLHVLVDGCLIILVNLYQVLSVFYLHSLLFKAFLYILISTVHVLHEFVVGVHDRQGRIRMELAVLFVPTPNIGGYEEIVSLHLTCEGVGWYAKVRITTEEVVMPLRVFVKECTPGWVVFGGKNWVFRISPSLIKAFDSFHIRLKTGGKNEVIIRYFSSISQDYVVLFRDNFLYADALRVSTIHVDGQTCIWKIFGFGGLLLFINASNWVGLVDWIIEDYHACKVAVGNFIKMP
jgi:hypothetical protein